MGDNRSHTFSFLRCKDKREREREEKETGTEEKHSFCAVLTIKGCHLSNGLHGRKQKTKHMLSGMPPAPPDDTP